MASSYSAQILPNIPAVKMPTDLDVAWAAGIYEGEGTASGIKGRTIAIVSQKDPEILCRLRDMFGGGITLVRMGTPKYCHAWKIYGDVAREFFTAIFPYMSARRKVQIQNAGGLRFTGSVCYREMKISDERKAKRVGMTLKERNLESQLHYISKNSEKVKAYQRGYTARKRQLAKQIKQQEFQQEVIQ